MTIRKIAMSVDARRSTRSALAAPDRHSGQLPGSPQHALAACTPPFMPVHDARDRAQQLRLILAMAPSTAHN